MTSTSPEQRLFYAVLVTAFEDALRGGGYDYGNSRMKPSLKEGKRKMAQDYLLGRSRDFRTVCEYAGFEPDYVYKIAKIFANRGWKQKDRYYVYAIFALPN